jgi:hypothetical protein
MGEMRDKIKMDLKAKDPIAGYHDNSDVPFDSITLSFLIRLISATS